ncbi:MAG: recombinase family protein, partial [Candidatus Aceula meridiana]|nr:recombinase family protein [Candidatus Aceula meridiana]
MNSSTDSKQIPLVKQIVKCAIYTRKSTQEGLEKDFTTLDAQRESAENYIASQKSQGWIALPEKYDDGGFTGANIDRPAVQQLLKD